MKVPRAASLVVGLAVLAGCASRPPVSDFVAFPARVPTGVPIILHANWSAPVILADADAPDCPKTGPGPDWPVRRFADRSDIIGPVEVRLPAIYNDSELAPSGPGDRRFMGRWLARAADQPGPLSTFGLGVERKPGFPSVAVRAPARVIEAMQCRASLEALVLHVLTLRLDAPAGPFDRLVLAYGILAPDRWLSVVGMGRDEATVEQLQASVQTLRFERRRP